MDRNIFKNFVFDSTLSLRAFFAKQSLKELISIEIASGKRRPRNDTNLKLQILKLFLCLALVSFILPCPGWGKQLISVDNALVKIFPKAQFEKKIIKLTREQIVRIEQKADISFEDHFNGSVSVMLVKKNGEKMGFVFEDTVFGKWGPIHFLLCLNLDGTVLDTIVLDYQEIRGKPIAKPRFLKQYKGKGIKDPLELRVDIDGITGATISSRSLTEGVKRNVFIFEEIKDDLR